MHTITYCNLPQAQSTIQRTHPPEQYVHIPARFLNEPDRSDPEMLKLIARDQSLRPKDQAPRLYLRQLFH